MPRKPNYRFERHERERVKAAKKAARAEAKAEKKAEKTGTTGAEEQPAEPSASDPEKAGTG